MIILITTLVRKKADVISVAIYRSTLVFFVLVLDAINEGLIKRILRNTDVLAKTKLSNNTLFPNIIDIMKEE